MKKQGRPSETKKAQLEKIKAKNMARHKSEGMTHRIELNVYKYKDAPQYVKTLIKYVKCIKCSPEEMAAMLLTSEGSTFLNDFKVEVL